MIHRIPFRAAWRARSMHAWFWPALAVLAAHTALVAARILPIRGREEGFVLHYSTALGIDRVGPWYLAFAPAAAGLLIILVNAGMSLVFVSRDRVLAHFIGAATFALEVGLLAAGVIIILLNV